MKRSLFVSVIVLTLFHIECARTAPIRFDFILFDIANEPIGTGYYQFDEIAPETKKTFANLTDFSWAFSVPVYDIELSSANGDSPGALNTEGIELIGLPGSRTLHFFDDGGGVFIMHQDLSDPGPGLTGIEFVGLSSNSVFSYYKNWVPTNPPVFIPGLFVAADFVIPEPSSRFMIGIVISLLSCNRRTLAGIVTPRI